ncbi:hypothetical protein [Paenibacillus sp. OV219]|uniref:CTP synthase C-terminal region-related (seleno)protein n=1 Tax=Paenibacillus sp. OV219 TaxID=1884377 RepID=UPI0008ADEF8C|nr:hypothetical protein [Paenibacillus sp. OV219]SEO82947.1 Glutamine amidotransferase class-I [Paenibacillus sp. OV219]
MQKVERIVRIGLIGDYKPEVKAHAAIPLALELAAAAVACEVRYEWIPTTELDEHWENKLATYNALWSVPASPYASMQGALNGIRFAREHGIPLLGTCGGFQHMVIEYARNVLGLIEADHQEVNPDASLLLVTPLTCTLRETTDTFILTPSSLVAKAYGRHEITEQYGTCSYGLNAAFLSKFERSGMPVVGVDTDGIARIMELTSHPFYIGALFQPERSALRGEVHPLIKAYLHAALGYTSAR